MTHSEKFAPCLWLQGSSRSGKTTRLIQEFCTWLGTARPAQPGPTALILAANDDTRWELADRLATATGGRYSILAKTPLGFISDEVKLFFPLLFEQLGLKAQFPLRLRPEMEQELALNLWQETLEQAELTGIMADRFTRETLDLLQLAGASGLPSEDIPILLAEGLVGEDWRYQAELHSLRGALLATWRQWSLERGLLSYGTIYEIYWRYLLPEASYQHHLTRRYRAIFADDVDDYPAIARDLFEYLLAQGVPGVFTYNPHGQVRLGLNADPDYLSELQAHGRVETLVRPAGLAPELGAAWVKTLTEPEPVVMPATVRSLQTISRAELLRQTAERISQAIRQGEAKPGEIAIIAPGLDAIGRYSLIEILTQRDIPVEPLNEQRPLIGSPLVRALLTLLALVFPGLGALAERNAVAELLVVLSRRQEWGDSEIDPVRAGLLADYCYVLDTNRPRLLVGTHYPRWDRLGHRAMNAYEVIRRWVTTEQERPGQRALALLDRAQEQFLTLGSPLPFDQLAALRGLMETAEHFWEVERRLQQHTAVVRSPTASVAQFIQLLRRGTITANAYPARPLGRAPNQAVLLATIYQYRSLRRRHRWQVWLDVGSRLWEEGGAASLFAAPLFLRRRSGLAWRPEDELAANRDRLERVLWDLLARVEERLDLCHSDLAVSGAEQAGPLLPLVYSSEPLVMETAGR